MESFSFRSSFHSLLCVFSGSNIVWRPDLSRVVRDSQSPAHGVVELKTTARLPITEQQVMYVNRRTQTLPKTKEHVIIV